MTTDGLSGYSLLEGNLNSSSR